MELFELKCPKCGASLEVADKKGKIECQYCNSEFMIEDNTIRVEHYGKEEMEKEQLYENAKTYLNQFQDYEHALRLYRILSYSTANDPEIWLGILRCMTQDFEVKYYSNFKEIVAIYKKYRALANETKELKEVTKKMNTLQRKVTEQNKKIREAKQRKKESILSFIIVCCVFVVIYLLTVWICPIKVNSNELKMSQIEAACENIDACDLGQIAKQNITIFFSDITNEEVHFAIDQTEYKIRYTVKNFITTKEFDYTLNVIDDKGPILTKTQDTCYSYIHEDLHLENCYLGYDLQDGYMALTMDNFDVSEVDKDAIGMYNAVVTMVDSDKNESTANIKVSIVYREMTKLDLNLEKTKIGTGEKLQVTPIIEPTTFPDKTLVYTSSNTEVATIDENGLITGISAGKTTICAKSEYGNQKETCQEIQVTVACKNTYEFTSDGSKLYTLAVDTDYCAGTYKVYADVLNTNDSYYIRYGSTSSYQRESILIWKYASSLSGEGSKAALSDDSVIEVPMGITKLKLVKTN